MVPPVKLRFYLVSDELSRRRTTYSLGHIGLSTESTVEADSVISSNSFDDLSAGNIGVSLVGEERLDKGRCVGNVAGIVRAIEDVVLEDSTNEARIRRNLLRNSGIIEKHLKGIVPGSEDGNVPQLGKRSSKARLGLDETYKSKQQYNNKTIQTYRSAQRGYHSWSQGHRSEKCGSEPKQRQQGQETRD